MPDPAIDATKQVKVKRPPGRPYNRPTKHNQTVGKLLKAGLTEREIAQAVDLSKTAIHHIIHRDYTQNQIEGFRVNEAESLDAFRMQYLKYIDPDAIKKMISTRGLTDYGIALDKANMIRTGNDGTSKPMVLIQIAGQAINITQATDSTTQHDSMTHETDSETAGAVTDLGEVGSAAKPAI